MCSPGLLEGHYYQLGACHFRTTSQRRESLPNTKVIRTDSEQDARGMFELTDSRRAFN